MKTLDLDYYLPENLIAKYPAKPRDSARLLVFGRQNQDIAEGVFRDLPKYLKSGDVLVLNKTRVFPARIWAQKESVQKIEILFLEEVQKGVWEILLRGKAKDGEKVFLTPEVEGTIQKNQSLFLKINLNKKDLLALLEEKGEVPLPPYLKRRAEKKDEESYQTIFAQKIGSAAAPTAGLHFTKRLIQKLESQGVQIEFINLNIGLGTFAPIKTEKVEDHPIHAERVDIDAQTAQSLSKAKKEKRRIIACGTTVVRALESASDGQKIKEYHGETSLYIYPGYQFRFVDGLITNFHTPKSSLLALVYAFGGTENMKKVYQYAIKKKYRFFSYGDAMLIL